MMLVLDSQQRQKSIINMKRMITVFKEGDKVIEANIDQFDPDEKREVILYNPDPKPEIQKLEQ